MDRSDSFHRGIEQQEAFFTKLSSLVKPQQKSKPKPQVRAMKKPTAQGVFIPLKTQGCYLLVRKV